MSSAKRAKRRRLAREAQQRETSHSHQMDPSDLSEHGTDLEEEDDHEYSGALNIASKSTDDHRLRDRQYGKNIKQGKIQLGYSRHTNSCARRMWPGTRH